MSDPKQIWLAPICHEDGDGRQWCQDDVWGDDCGCDIAEHQSVRYVLATDYDRLEQECEQWHQLCAEAQVQRDQYQDQRDAALKQVEVFRAALAKAALSMWHSESNMDNEAADAEEVLAGAALQEPNT